MLTNSAEDLIDRIYEAAVAPELWPAVLTDLTEIGGGRGSLLFTIDGDRMRYIASPGVEQLVAEYVEQGWPAKTTRAARLFAARYPGFMNDLDVYTREEMDREPVFTEFLRPRGLGWGAATAIPVPSGDTLVFDVEKDFAGGPVPRATLVRLDKLRPHLARAALLSARLKLERARTAAETMDLVGLPVAVLARGGRALAMNRRFEELIPAAAADRLKGLTFSDPAVDMLFADACRRIECGAEAGGVRSIPVRATADHPPMILHLVPVRGVANDVFTSASAILVVTPVEPRKVPNAEVLQGLFDLSPAEARVARAIAEGRTIEHIAACHGVSKETVRSQLGSTLDKTGLGRQAELAALLSGLAPAINEPSPFAPKE